jgi:Protein of unknown function (DUF1579)
MRSKQLLVLVCVAAVGLAAIGSWAIADASKDSKAPAGLPPDFKLPPGWTMEDMQACMAAATPGEMQKHLTDEVGVWNGKVTNFMPGSEPLNSECVSTVTSLMDGRFIKCEIKGEMPGMGPFNGLGIYGFDNVSKKFVSMWIDNMGTGIMNGTGDLSADGKTMTWACSANCPLTKKAMAIREIDTMTGPNTKRMEMFGPDPKTGKEMKTLTIEFTKKS